MKTSFPDKGLLLIYLISFFQLSPDFTEALNLPESRDQDVNVK